MVYKFFHQKTIKMEEKKKSGWEIGKKQPSPVIPESVYDSLPNLLKECCSKFINRERDVFLTSALTIMSGCLPNVKGAYGKGYSYTNLFALISAPPASGKGVMNFAKILGEEVHSKILNSSKNGDVQVLFIPANTSSAMMMQHLQNNGGSGILCASEADTLINALKQEWGNFSDMLRSGFHHETIECSRKGDHVYIRIPNPRISLLLTGTPDQIKELVPSAENGLFSRNLFYTYQQEPQWKDNSPCPECYDSIDYFKEKSKVVDTIHSYYLQNPIEFSMKKEHWDAANNIFKEQLDLVSLSHGDDAISIINRIAVIQFRLAMILTAIRNAESGSPVSGNLCCTDQDFQISMELVNTYLEHSLYMLESIPKSNAKFHVGNKDSFFEKLPAQFKREEALWISAGLKFSPRTTDRYLSLFCKKGKLLHLNQGNYKKVE